MSTPQGKGKRSFKFSNIFMKQPAWTETVPWQVGRATWMEKNPSAGESEYRHLMF